MSILKKIKASALQFAILVSVIVALLLGSFMTLTYSHQFFKMQSQFLLDVVQESQLGIEYSNHTESSLIDITAFENENLDVSVDPGFWGGFMTVKSTAVIKTKSFTKMGLVGTGITNPKTSIYITDPQTPLVLVGNSQIKGTAYVSDKGIKAGVIAGNYFQGKELVHGAIRRSNAVLPALDDRWLNGTRRLLNNTIPLGIEMISSRTQNTASFFENTKMFYSSGNLLLTQEYIGNLIIKSDSEIIVSKYAKLTDVVLIAPKITVKSGFTGTAHFLADSSIKIEENVHLSYPSSIILIDKNNDLKKNIPKGEEPIYISENTTISGSIIYLPKETSNTHTNTSITIRTNAMINGSIYCQGNIELLGTVIGSVYTNRFVANEFGSKYINHIYNGRILGEDISKEYYGLPFKNVKKGVAKWLY